VGHKSAKNFIFLDIFVTGSQLGRGGSVHSAQYTVHRWGGIRD
jgi:hypothetical protein